MKAVAVFPGSHEIKLIEQEAPRISQPDQVMVRMLDIGICGTDRRSVPLSTAPRRPAMITW